jgi:hypothetical protein
MIVFRNVAMIKIIAVKKVLKSEYCKFLSAFFVLGNKILIKEEE